MQLTYQRVKSRTTRHLLIQCLDTADLHHKTDAGVLHVSRQAVNAAKLSLNTLNSYSSNAKLRPTGGALLFLIVTVILFWHSQTQTETLIDFG